MIKPYWVLLEDHNCKSTTHYFDTEEEALAFMVLCREKDKDCVTGWGETECPEEL